MTAFLLNPNIAYLSLVLGFFLIVFAILQPGTGMFELSAVFVLFLAAWQIYHLQIHVWALVLLILSLLPFVLAIWREKYKKYLALAVVSFVIGSAFLYRDGVQGISPAVNPVLSLVVSFVGGGLMWIVTSKMLEARNISPSHNLSSLIGQLGEARTDVFSTGTIYAAGELWTAKSDKKIKQNSRVKVIGRDGFILLVEDYHEEE